MNGGSTPRMTHTSIEETDREEAELVARLRATQRMFAGIRTDLEAVAEKLEAGGAEAVPSVTKQVNEIRTTILQCIKSETDIDKLRDDRRGYINGQRPLDLGQARSEIRRALDRLRT